MRRSLTHVGALVLLVSLLAGCSGDDESEETTTSTTAAPVTSLATTQAPTTTAVVPAGGDDTSTTTTTEATQGEVAFPGYTIVERVEGEGDEGDTLVILIDTDADDAITDIDLQSLLSEVVDEFGPVNEAFVVDSLEAAQIVLLDEFTQEQVDELNNHFLARLEEGFRVIFEGPFEGLQPLLISS